MSGSIIFRSGAMWSAGSGAFDRSIETLLGDSDDPERIEHLRDALTFGHLAMQEIPNDLADAFESALASEKYRTRFFDSITAMNAFTEESSQEVVDELSMIAKREATLPKWLRCDKENIIVAGLTEEAISALGIRAWPLQKKYLDKHVSFKFALDDIEVHLDLAPNDSHQAPAGGYEVSFSDAHVSLTSTTPSDDRLVKLARALAAARDRCG